MPSFKSKKSETRLGSNTVRIDKQKVGNQYHVYLKECVRDALKLQKGDVVEFHVIDNEIVLRKKQE